MTAEQPVALVTGASSGIGHASARALAAAGFRVVAGARRMDRLVELAEAIGGRAVYLDVTDADSVATMAQTLDRLDLVVHCAGGAVGFDPVVSGDIGHWDEMYQTNVVGVVRVTQAVIGYLRTSDRGHIVILGSIAGTEVYPNGGGYTAAKHAVHALARTLRLELHTEGIRVSEIAPGMVETEFSLVRFDGDGARAAKVYEGLTPLTADDVAEAVAFVATRPPYMDVDYTVLKPTAQASAMIADRRG